MFLEISQNSQENTRCFPVNLAKFLRTLFLQNTSGRLLLFSLIILFRLFHRPLFVSEVGLSRSKSQTMVAPGNKSITHLTVNYTNKELSAIIISSSSSNSKQCIDTLSSLRGKDLNLYKQSMRKNFA